MDKAAMQTDIYVSHKSLAVLTALCAVASVLGNESVARAAACLQMGYTPVSFTCTAMSESSVLMIPLSQMY
jgi:hypothetical protein